MRLLLLALCLATLLPARGAESAVQSAYDRLLKVERFGFGGFGYAGSVTGGEKDFRLVCTAPNRLELFVNLFEEGNPQAKLYALVAMKSLDKNLFEKLAQRISAQNPKVSTFYGCEVMDESARDLVGKIRKGEYDLYLKKENWRQ